MGTKRPTDRRHRSGHQPAGRSADRLDNLEMKRQRFEESGRFPLRKVVLIVTAIAVVSFVGMAGYSKMQAGKQASSGVEVSDVQSAGSGGNLTMTPIEIKVSGDKATFPLAEVQAKKLVGLKYQRQTPFSGEWQQLTGGALPLIAYIAPSGNLVVASSFCEPCRSNSFHIEGEDLVCDACGTRWDLSTLEGKSGGCTAYPPDPLTVENVNGTITVNTADLEAWAPRA